MFNKKKIKVLLDALEIHDESGEINAIYFIKSSVSNGQGHFSKL